MDANPIAARTLEDQAALLADSACDIFLRTDADEQSWSQEIRDEWSHHFRQRILELSAALATGEKALFTSRVLWSRQALHARMQDRIPLGKTLHSLRSALIEQLPDDVIRDALVCIDQAIKEYQYDLPEEQVSSLDPSIPNQRLALLYLQAALEGNTHQAMATVLDAIGEHMTHAEAITEVLLPAQHEVGHLWHIDHITIAEEHLVTTTTQRLMAVLVDRAESRPDSGKTAVAASISGNVHDIGIRAIGYLMELDGWRTIYLGSDVPRNDLPAAIHFYNADVAMLSVALSSQLPKLQQSIAAIRSLCEHAPKIIVGGGAFGEAPNVWRALGADGHAPNAESAVRLANELTSTLAHH